MATDFTKKMLHTIREGVEKAKQDNLFNFNFGQHFSEIAGKIKGLDLFHKVVKKVCNLLHRKKE
jgi:hypothetical protein